jgi:hypothetical protein
MARLIENRGGFLFHGATGVVTYLLVGIGQAVEERGFTGIGPAGENDFFHGLTLYLDVAANFGPERKKLGANQEANGIAKGGHVLLLHGFALIEA